MTEGLSAPQGGELITCLAGEIERTELQERAQAFPHVILSSRQLADLELLAVGAYSPLTGFMTRSDYLAVVSTMHLSNGLPWSIPITLATTTEDAASLRLGSELALVDAQGTLHAVMILEEKYDYDKQLETRKVYRTEEESHPGVNALYQQGNVLLGG